MSSPASSLDPNRRLIELLKKLFAGFGKVPSTEQLQAYIEALSDLEIPQLDHGVKRALRNQKFLPTPSEIREIAQEIPRQQKVHPADCEVCGGTGWAYSKLLRKALRCDDYVKWKAEVSVIADELLAKFEALDFESGPLERIPSPLDHDRS